jgi:hypothetical protein
MDLPPDYVREQLDKLRVIKVEVVLATSLMKKHESGTINPFPGHASTIDEVARSYSWPRVTFQVGDKIKRIPMTFYARSEKEHATGLSTMARIVLRVAVGSFNPKMLVYRGRQAALDAAVARTGIAIRSKINSASKKKSVQRRTKIIVSRLQKNKMAENLAPLLKEAVGILQEHELLELFREHKRLSVCAKIQES